MALWRRLALTRFPAHLGPRTHSAEREDERARLRLPAVI